MVDKLNFFIIFVINSIEKGKNLETKNYKYYIKQMEI